MAVKLSALRVVAEADTSSYVAGMNQKAAADRKAIASSEALGAAMANADEVAGRSGGNLIRLSRTYVDGYGTASKFNAAVKQLQTQMELGNVSAERAGTIYLGMVKKFGAVADEAKIAASGNAAFAGVVASVNSELGDAVPILDRSVRAHQAHNAVLGIGSTQFASLLHSGRGAAEMLAQGVPITQIAAMEMNNLAYAMMGPEGLIAGFKGVLPALTLWLASPVGRIATIVTVATAALGGLFLATRQNAPSAEDALKRQADLIKQIGEAYGDAAAAAKQYGTESRAVMQFQAVENARVALAQLVAEERKGVNSLYGETGPLRTSQAGIDIFDQITASLDAQRPAILAAREALVAFAAAIPTQGVEAFGQHLPKQDLQDIIDKFLIATQGLANMELQLKASDAAMSRAAGHWHDGAAELALMNKQAEILADTQTKLNADLAAISSVPLSPLQKGTMAWAQVMAEPLDVTNGGLPAQWAKADAAARVAEAKAIAEVQAAEIARTRARDASIASAKVDLQTVGLGIAEQTRLRTEYQLTAAAMEDAYQRGVAVSAQELAAIKANAAALGQLAEQAARAKVLSDIKFNMATLGLSDQDVQIATQLRSIYADVGKALASPEAAALRLYNRLKDIRQVGLDMVGALGSSLEQVFNGSIKSADDLFNSLTKGFADIEAKLIASKLTDWFSGGANPFAAIKAANDNGATALHAAATHLLQVGPSLVTAANALDRVGTGAGAGATGGAGAAWFNYAGGGGRVSVQQINPNGTPASAANAWFGIVKAANDSLTTTAGQLARAAAAIKSIESGGNYGIEGPITGSGDRAYGAYQVMGANISAWTKEALGYSMTAQAFLKDSAAQDKVFNVEFGKLVNKFGNYSDAASAWFTGRPLATGANAADVNGMTGSRYVDLFNARFGGSSAAAKTSVPVNVTTPSVNLGVSGGQGTTLGNFLRSPAFASIVGGFSMGYQQQNPIMGGFSGALGGFMQGGVMGGVVGGLAGLLGGIFGKAKAEADAAKAAAEQAKAAWEQLQPEVEQFRQQALGAWAGGDLTKNIAAANAEANKLIDAAKKAGEDYSGVLDDLRKYIADQNRQFMATFSATLQSLNAGTGFSGAGLQAAQQTMALVTQLFQFITDASKIKPPDDTNPPPGPGRGFIPTNPPRPPDPEEQARAAAVAQLKAMAAGGAAALSTIQTAIQQMTANAPILTQALEDLGVSAKDAGAIVQDGLNKQLEKLKSDFSASLTQRYNAATGNDIGNQFAALTTQHQQDLADLAALYKAGAYGPSNVETFARSDIEYRRDQQKADDVFRAEMTKAFSDAFGTEGLSLTLKPQLTQIASELDTLKKARSALIVAWRDMGMATADAIDKANAEMKAAVDRLQADFSAALTARDNTATGQQWKNALADIVKQHNQDIADAILIGASKNPVNQVFRDELTKWFADTFGMQGLSLTLKPQMSEIATQYQNLKDARAALIVTLCDLGTDVADAIRIANDDMTAAVGDIRTTFSAGLTQRLNAATGKDWVNQIDDLVKQHAQDLADAALIGASANPVNAVFDAELQKIVDDAGLVGDAFGQFLTLFPDLAGVVHQSATVVNQSVKSIQDYLNGLKTGEMSPLSPAEKLAAAQGTFATQLALARTGNSDALGGITGTFDALLQAARDYYRSGKGYADIYASGTSDLQGLSDLLAGHVTGGLVGNGVWNRDSVIAGFAGGGSVMLAGGEYVVRAPSVNPQTLGLLNTVNWSGAPPANDNRMQFDRLIRAFAISNREEADRIIDAIDRLTARVGRLEDAGRIAQTRQDRIPKRTGTRG